MRSRQSGFTLLAVLVLAGVVTTVAIGYAHHVLVDQRASLATPSAVAVREQAHSAIAYARQAVTSGLGAASALSADGVSAQIQVAQLGGGHQGITVTTSTASGHSNTRIVESSLVLRSQCAPATPAALPTLSAAVVADLSSDGTITQHLVPAGVTSWTDTDVEGLVVLQDGAELHLSGVVLKGAIVSESVMNEWAPLYDAQTHPTVVIDGDLRIDAGSFLPGVAIVLPDGEVTTSYYPGRLQIVGDIVAHDVTLELPGAAHGNILCVGGASLATGLERVGQGRGSAEWADGLELNGSWATAYMAVIPHVADAAAIAAVAGYWSSP